MIAIRCPWLAHSTGCGFHWLWISLCVGSANYHFSRLPCILFVECTCRINLSCLHWPVIYWGLEKPNHAQITRIIEGFETWEIRSYFDKWPWSGPHPVSEGRGKVAGTLNILILLPSSADHTSIISGLRFMTRILHHIRTLLYIQHINNTFLVHLMQKN